MIASASGLQCATFRVCGLLFGIDVGKVQELIRQQEMSPIPLAPRAVVGLINLRGQMVTVLDPRFILGLKAAEGVEQRVNLVARSGDAVISLLVDEICDVVEVPATCCVEVPETMPLAQRRLMQCVVQMGQELMLVLDCEELLDAAFG